MDAQPHHLRVFLLRNLRCDSAVACRARHEGESAESLPRNEAKEVEIVERTSVRYLVYAEKT